MLRARSRALEFLPVVVAAILLYWQAAVGRGVFFERDVFLYWAPRIEWAVRALAAGHLPQWDPYMGFGLPFLSDPNFQPFYPFTWLNLVIQAPTVFSIMVVGHSIIGAVGMFKLLRPRLRSREAAWTGAVVFVAAGPVASSATLWHHFASAAYIPWIVDAFLRTRAGRGWIRFGVCVAIQALAGSADACAMTILGLCFLLPVSLRRCARLAPRLIAAGFLSMALAAVQWVPTILNLADTGRASLTQNDRLYWSVAPETIGDFLLPLSGAAHAARGDADALEHRFRMMTWMYMGASTLPLLIAGARRFPRGLLALAVSLLLAMGKYTPLGSLSSLPIVSVFRFPSKLLWFFSLCWAALTAIGLADLAYRRPKRTWKELALGVSLVGVAVLLANAPGVALPDSPDWRQIREMLPWAPLMLGLSLLACALTRRADVLAAIVICDLVVMGQTYHPYSKSGELYRTRPGVVDVLRGDHARRLFIPPSSREPRNSWKSPPNWSDEEAFYFSQGQVLVPPQGTRWGFRGSFDGDFTGLARRDYSLLCALVGARVSADPRLLRMGGVTHVVSWQGAGDENLPIVATVPAFSDRPVVVTKVTDPLPTAYLVSRAQYVNSSEEGLRAIEDPSFDPRHKVVLMRDHGAPRAEGDAGPGLSVAEIESEEDGRLSIRVKSDVAQTLVVLNAYSSGWRARIDGKKTAVNPANLVFQSVEVDAGEHRVELAYQTPGLVFGSITSALAWLAVAAFARRARRNDESMAL